jgi:hypothetical protein
MSNRTEISSDLENGKKFSSVSLIFCFAVIFRNRLDVSGSQGAVISERLRLIFFLFCFFFSLGRTHKRRKDQMHFEYLNL